jgi:FixJ family two-component response regulator
MPKSPGRHRSTKPDFSATTTHVVAIVDDDESFRGAVVRLLRSLGHSVAAFDSAEDFLQSNRVDETECLICDVRMPRMSGLELQSDLIGKGFRLPIIFVTANPTETARRSAIGAGAIGYLSKPFDEATLIALLDEALG